MKLKIEKEDIDFAYPCNPTHCVIAHAAKRAFGMEVFVSPTHIYPGGVWGAHVPEPLGEHNARTAIEDFDGWRGWSLTEVEVTPNPKCLERNPFAS